MREQIPAPKSTTLGEPTCELRARTVLPSTADPATGDVRIRRRFGEECLRWPERPVRVFPSLAAGWRPAAGDGSLSGGGSYMPAVGRRSAIPREHGPPG
jgi:hypothetical protein